MSTLKKFSDSLIFPLGDKLPEQFSKFFIGQAHLNMLTTTGVSIEFLLLVALMNGLNL